MGPRTTTRTYLNWFAPIGLIWKSLEGSRLERDPSKPLAEPSSREIAELTGKNHFDVMRDTRVMLEQLGEVESKFAGYYKASNGKQNPLYNLPKDLTITLVSGYNVQMRHRIVTRWQELEAKVSQPAIPQSLPEALRLAAVRICSEVRCRRSAVDRSITCLAVMPPLNLAPSLRALWRNCTRSSAVIMRN